MIAAPPDFTYPGGFIHVGRGISSTITVDNGFVLA